jgi:DNA polymerase-4
MSRTILHVDMDEFFAAVEKLDRPELRGKCLLIGGDPRKRGVVATASYEARRFGCHSAQPMAVAVRRCPHAIRLPGRHERYRQVSRDVFEILSRYSPLLEPLSIDEAFLDCTGCDRLLGDAGRIARSIKKTIREELGLTASVGTGPNKFLAKLASDLRKPDGLCIITPPSVHDILDPLEIRKLWGVGPAVQEKLNAMGVRTVGQLRSRDEGALVRALGDLGSHLLRLANGQDDRPVTPDNVAKSIGQEQTFERDVDRLEILQQVLLSQVEQVARRLRTQDLLARVVTLKLRSGDFSTVTRAGRLETPSSVTETLWQRARGILDQWARTQLAPLRLLGVTASDLQGRAGRQQGLFETQTDRKGKRLDAAADSIRSRFGLDSLKRGLNLQPPDRQ